MWKKLKVTMIGRQVGQKVGKTVPDCCVPGRVFVAGVFRETWRLVTRYGEEGPAYSVSCLQQTTNLASSVKVLTSCIQHLLLQPKKAEHIRGASRTSSRILEHLPFQRLIKRDAGCRMIRASVSVENAWLIESFRGCMITSFLPISLFIVKQSFFVCALLTDSP